MGAPVVCASLALLGVVGLLLAGSPQAGKGDTRENTGVVSDVHSGTLTDSVLPDADSLSRTFRAAAKRVLPAVVVVKTSSNPQAAAIPRDGVEQFSDRPFQDGDDEEDVEGYFFEEEVEHQPGLASGVIIDPKGIVLTNQHVIDGAGQVTVLLPNGREFSVRQITSLPGIDLAVLRLDNNELLPAATLGDSDTLEIGDWILTMGCPLELEQTVSAGIISAKGRSGTRSRTVRVCFRQTRLSIPAVPAGRWSTCAVRWSGSQQPLLRKTGVTRASVLRSPSTSRRIAKGASTRGEHNSGRARRRTHASLQLTP